MDTGLICIQGLTLDVPFGSIKIQNFFFLEFFSTFTHEQIHFSYKIIRNELFFFFFFYLNYKTKKNLKNFFFFNSSLRLRTKKFTFNIKSFGTCCFFFFFFFSFPSDRQFYTFLRKLSL